MFEILHYALIRYIALHMSFDIFCGIIKCIKVFWPWSVPNLSIPLGFVTSCMHKHLEFHDWLSFSERTVFIILESHDACFPMKNLFEYIDCVKEDNFYEYINHSHKFQNIIQRFFVFEIHHIVEYLDQYF